MAAEKGGYFTPIQYRYLEVLASEPSVEDVWKRIVKRCGNHPVEKMRFFIADIVRGRSFAASSRAWPDYLTQAKNTEQLIRFLEGTGQFPPPMPEFSAIVPKLKEMAVTMRNRAQRFHISREIRNDVQQYVLFMQLLSYYMQEHFNRWFDDEVAHLTNVFFPKADVTRDSVLAARKRGKIPRAA
jgi:hypothetical protein